jgi:hypothetical protein
MAKAKKKWGHLVGTLPDAPADPSYGDALGARVEALQGTPLKDLVAQYNAADEAVTEADRVLAEKNFEKEALTRALTRALEAAGLDSIAAEGYTFTPVPEPKPSVKDRAVFLAWAREHYPDNLMMHHQTLSSLVKSSLEGDGSPMPPGVDVFMTRRLSRTKA